MTNQTEAVEDIPFEFDCEIESEDTMYDCFFNEDIIFDILIL